MNSDRRTFIRRGLFVLGSVATGAAIANEVSSKAVAAARSTAAAGSSNAMCGCGDMPAMLADAGPATMALTHDHQLVKHQGGKVISLPVVRTTPREGIPGRKFVMVIDLSKCDGCGSCTVACGKMHFIPPDRQWLKVLRMQDSETTAPYFFPQPCYHCDNPPCTKVCPVDATFKRQDGIVLIDNERCIGCRFCMAACPYGARSFNWGHPHDPPQAAATEYSPEQGFPRRIGTVEKCDFCPDMAAKGQVPACTSGCPMGAIYYGDENEDAVTNSQHETLRLSKLLVDRAAYRHLEELGTKPRVYYLPPANRQFPFAGPAREHEHSHE